MTVINWPLLILTDSPEFSKKLTIAGMVIMYGNETKVTNKRFDGNWGMYTKDLPHSNTFLLSEYHLFYLEVTDALRLLVMLKKTVLSCLNKHY